MEKIQIDIEMTRFWRYFYFPLMFFLKRIGFKGERQAVVLAAKKNILTFYNGERVQITHNGIPVLLNIDGF